jgi:acetyl-CoA carboxylase biotin carboxyl carrier protein
MKKTQDEIRQIATWMSAAGLGALELRTPEERLRLGRGGVAVAEAMAEANAAADPVARRAPACAAESAVRAPSVGVFLLRHPGRTGPLAGAGQRVSTGQPIGLLQVGALLLSVAAPSDGVVRAVRANDGAMVGFGTPLFDFQAL